MASLLTQKTTSMPPIRTRRTRNATRSAKRTQYWLSRDLAFLVPSRRPAPSKEVTTCSDCREAVAAEKADGSYCKIHQTKVHDLQECHQVEQLVKKQKAEYEKRDKERDQDSVGGKVRGGRGGRPSKVPQQQGKPARGHEKKECDDKSDEGDEEETSEQ